MAGTSSPSWASGAPKWAAVVVLASAAVAGVAWSMGREGQVWRVGPGRAEAAPIIAAPGGNDAPGMPPTAATATAKAAAAQPAPTVRTLVNVNTASQGELEMLPGIGPALARRIIEYRTTRGPFRRVEDLDAVKGIGPKLLERIRGMVSVE